MQPDENFWEKFEGEQIANTYELEQLLGCGTYGGVFRAAQIANGKKLEKRVAIKLMLSGKIQQEELNFALNLPSHQNLVQHFTGNNVEISRLKIKMFYLVMELADCSLADFVKKRGGRISSVEAKAIVRDIAQGLKFLHELDGGNSQDKRYVHRDLKLLNVLQVGGVWKIADFGLSKALDRGTMQASKIAGTPYYMPPELFRNGYVSTKWDMWSFGVMIVEMLTGHFPFEAGGNANTEVVIKELERKIERESPNLQGVPIEWIDVVKGCLVKDHERRWAAADILNVIESIGLSASIPPTIPQLQSPIPQKTQLVHVTKSSSNGFLGMLTIIGFISGISFLIWHNVRAADQSPIISSPVSRKTATDLFDDGMKKYHKNDYKGAIADFNEAIRLKPDDAKTYNVRGLMKYYLADFQGAITDYNEAIRINPNYAEAYNNRGHAKTAFGNLQEVLADYNEALRLKPDYYIAYNNRGTAKSELGGDQQGAIADYNEAIRLKPDYPHSYFSRGMIKYYRGDKQGAIADYNEVIRLKPNDDEAYYLRGLAKYDLGNKQKAISDYNEAIRLNSNYALFYYNRGIAKSDLGDKQGAINDYTEAIRINQNWRNKSLEDAYYSRGLIKKERGDKQEALADFRKASELYQQQGNTEWYNKSRDRIKELGG
jgi:serine/threonine protein kinase